jgi:hypothetical protein
MEHSDIIEKLQSNKCWVTFTKVNGEMRRMWCTLDPEFLPKQIDIKYEVKSKEAPTAIPVWDLEKSEWRSFRVDSVLKIEKGIEV